MNLSIAPRHYHTKTNIPINQQKQKTCKRKPANEKETNRNQNFIRLLADSNTTFELFNELKTTTMNQDKNEQTVGFSAIDLEADVELRPAPMKAVVVTKPKNLRGGADDQSKDGTEGDQGSEKSHISEKAISQHGGQDEYLSTKAKEKRDKRKRILAILLCLLLLAILAVALALGLQQDDSQTAGVIEVPATSAPTAEGETYTPTTTPTSEPTAGDTPFPTVVPSPGPTPEVTFPTVNTISELPCDQIQNHTNVTSGRRANSNFLYENVNGVEICADTFAGFQGRGDYDEETDTYSDFRSWWNADTGYRGCPLLSFSGVVDVCETPGARLCKAEELAAFAGLSTGCGGDNTYLWSLTPCDDGGYYKINLDLKASGGSDPFYLCETDLEAPSLARCCGDQYEVESDGE
eukprot:maker-scaffold_5-snap-gene-0.5-mRNA-1 protein AED:0.06 eAED:0.06 QI:0/0.33/0.25/1/0/0/4/193/406